MPRKHRSAEELEDALLTRADWNLGEKVTFRILRHKGSPERLAIINIQAGDHPPPMRKNIYPLWVQPIELDILLKRCKKVSNFYIYEPIS